MTATTLEADTVNDPEKIDSFFANGSHTTTQYAVAYLKGGRKAFAGPYAKDEVGGYATELNGWVVCRKVAESRSPWGITPDSMEAATKTYNPAYSEDDDA